MKTKDTPETILNAHVSIAAVSTVSVRARRRIGPMGSTALGMLREGVADLDRRFAQVFTVEGYDGGELRGRLVRAAQGLDHTSEGAWPSADASLFVARDCPWTPTEGRRLTIAGSEYRTGAPVMGRASWEVPLHSPHR